MLNLVLDGFDGTVCRDVMAGVFAATVIAVEDAVVDQLLGCRVAWSAGNIWR